MTSNATSAQMRAWLETEARRLGFLQVGVARAGFLEDEAHRLEHFLKQGYQGSMSYLERNIDKRLDPRLLVPGATTVICLLFNYYPQQQRLLLPKISKYAYGIDYHVVLKQKLKELWQGFTAAFGSFQGRVFTDSAPIMEKAWAQRSGLGWIGKNGNLINRKAGSFFFLSEIICDAPLEPDLPEQDHCGTCTRCLEACPTQAIVQPYVVDGSRCISHFTIELKEAIPPEWKDRMDGWAFGCDVCQDVCPWNRFSKPHSEPLFEPLEPILSWDAQAWEALNEDTFARWFGKSPLIRRGWQGVRNNMGFSGT
jgi:epoxyqueuosine reductase